MKLYNILFLALVLGSLISVASAEVQTLGDFKQNTCIELLQTCSNCTKVNITSVLYPTSSIAISDKIMTKSGTNYNYTFCNTNLAGKYLVYGIADVDGINTVWAYDFNILGIGNSGSKNITEVGFFILIAIIIAGFIYLKISKFFGSLLIFVLGFGILFTIPENGWIGWTVIGSGFLMVIYALITPKKRRSY